MIDYEKVGKRLADARRRRTAATLAETAAKSAKSKADSEIEECLDELESGEPSRPLLDKIEAKAEKPAERAPTNYWGKRERPKKSTSKIAGPDADRPDRILRPKGAAAAQVEQLAREAERR